MDGTFLTTEFPGPIGVVKAKRVSGWKNSPVEK
jgi:hypothetical protein